MPTRVEPVKAIMSMSGWRVSAVPTTEPRPTTMLNTPRGAPAACRICAKTAPEWEAISAGLSTMVQPAARAGATFSVICRAG